MAGLLRSVGAVVAGFLTMAVMVMVLTVIAVKAMGLKSGQPTSGYLVLNVVYSLAAAALGGWVTGWIARPRSLEHGYVLGGLMVVMGVLSYFQYKGTQPVWYQVLMTVVPGIIAILAAGWVGSSPNNR
jgi:hypothetical protein